jgi:alpha-glucosidase
MGAFGQMSKNLVSALIWIMTNVYADKTPSNFTLYEDDGLTLNYTDNGSPFYEYRTTAISQNQVGRIVNVTIDSAINQKGTATVTTPYLGAVMNRANIVKLVVDNASATDVTLNGQTLLKMNSQAEFDAASSGWYDAGDNLVLAKSDNIAVSTPKNFAFNLQVVGYPKASVNFVCDNSVATLGQSIYVVGNIPELGNWEPAKAVKLDPNIYYNYLNRSDKNLPGRTQPVWTGVVGHLPSNTSVEWKCLRREENDSFNKNAIIWQSGSNNKFMTTASGYVGHSYGKM